MVGYYQDSRLFVDSSVGISRDMVQRFFMTCPFWTATVGSLVIHAMVVAIFFHKPEQAFLNRSPVSVHIMPARRSAPAAPTVKQVKAPVAKPTPTPAPRAPEAPTAVASASDDAEGTPSASLSQDLIASGEHTAGLARDAALVRSTFAQSPYTRAAIQARYEADVVAEILVNAMGKAENIRFATPLQYGMEERLRRSIRGARFEVARNEQGDEVKGWTKIRFKLVIP